MNIWKNTRTFPLRLQEIFQRNEFRLENILIPEGDILNWGCSSGETSEELRTFYPNRRIISLDINEKVIKKAKRKYPHLEFHCMDGCDLSYFQEPFAAIFAMNNLIYGFTEHNISEHDFKNIVQELRSHIRSDGTLFFSTISDIFILQNDLLKHGKFDSLPRVKRLIYEASYAYQS